MVVTFQEEAVVLVKIDLHMKVAIVVVANNVLNVFINSKDHNQQMKQVVLNKVVTLGQMKLEMIIKHLLVVIVVVVEVDHDVQIMKEVEVVAEAVVAADVAILITEILKKVHSNRNNHNNNRKKIADGNKVPSM